MWRERRAETKTVFVSSLELLEPTLPRSRARARGSRIWSSLLVLCQERGRRAHARGKVLALVADTFCDDVGAAVPESEGVWSACAIMQPAPAPRCARGDGRVPQQQGPSRRLAASPPPRAARRRAALRRGVLPHARALAVRVLGAAREVLQHGLAAKREPPRAGARPRCVGRHHVGSRFLLARSVAHESCPPRPRTRTRPGHGRHPAAIRFSRGRGCGSAIV